MDIIDSQKGVSFGQNMQVRLQRSEEITESGTMTEKRKRTSSASGSKAVTASEPHDATCLAEHMLFVRPDRVARQSRRG